MQMFNFQSKVPSNDTIITRMVSGSACRSMFGGFVYWDKGGEIENGIEELSKKSISKQKFPSFYWKDICCFFVIFSKKMKTVSSTEGMKKSVKTSQLLKVYL